MRYVSNKTKLIRQFKAARVLLGISQDRAAFDTELSQKCISEFESGKRDPRISTLCKLADYYGFEIQLVDKCER